MNMGETAKFDGLNDPPTIQTSAPTQSPSPIHSPDNQHHFHPRTPSPTPSNDKNNDDDEEEEANDDKTQDYQQLLTQSTSKNPPPLLPRRGEKDFEPHGTQSQSSTLTASQAAMHSALSIERVHGPISSEPGHLTGVFDASTGLTTVPRERGVWFRSIGRAVKGGKGGGVLLEPEEALWMLERGSLEMLFGEGGGDGGSRRREQRENEDEDEDEMVGLDGVPMSLQAGYACCIGARGLTLERYIVYAGLKRAGYAVFRAKGGWGDDVVEDVEEEPVSAEMGTSSLQTWFQHLLSNLVTNLSPKPSLPLIGTGFFRDYSKQPNLPPL